MMEGLFSPLIPRKERNKMSKITKKQKKLQELLADFQQPASGREALVKLQEISKEVAKFKLTIARASNVALAFRFNDVAALEQVVHSCRI